MTLPEIAQISAAMKPVLSLLSLFPSLNSRMIVPRSANRFSRRGISQ